MKSRFTRQQRRPFDAFAEYGIRIVASLSILFILLIFIFMFREALTVFEQPSVPELVLEVPQEQPKSGSTDTPERTTTVTPPVPIPDRYTVLEEGGPEVYNPQPYELEAVRERQQRAYEQALAAAESAADGESESVVQPDIDSAEIVQEHAIAQGDTAAFPLLANMAGTVWQPVDKTPKYGVWPLVIGTLKTTVIAIAIGAPLGVLAAIFTAFFAGRRLRRIIKPAIELLAAFPSVVIGFFCLITVASMVQSALGTEFRLNALVGGIGLSLAVIPIIYTITEDALSAVPRSLREASLALGSSEWQTAYRVMLPAAAPGVFAAILLGIGRAFGETMIAIMATGNAALMSWLPTEPARTMAASIGSEMGEVVWGSEHYGVLFLLGVLLFLVSFGLNAVTEIFVKNRLLRRFSGR